MFIQGVIQKSPSRTGILLAHRSSDKFRELYDAKILSNLPGLAIALEQHPRFFNIVHRHHHHQQQQQQHRQYLSLTSCSKHSVYYPLVCVNVIIQVISLAYLLYPTNSSSACVFKLLTLYECSSDSLVIIVIIIVLVVSTVRTLYAETLATIWTTAPSLPQRPSAQLAAVCLFLATLTIAARCYASSNATHPLDQFNPSPSSFSPIDNSNAQVPHSSKLVLSRLLTSPHQPVQSDTRVIVINSKKLLDNQNSNSTTTRTRWKRFRTKRELKTSFYNQIISQYETKAKTIVKNSLDNNKLNLEKRSNVVVSTTSETNDSVGDSDNRVDSSLVNTIPLEAEHQNDSSFFDEDAPSAHSGVTERPMPPVHDHGNASSVSDLGVLVLVLSAIVLTVALGLITCVLSHYRPVAGEGAADGGTAADPSDAARAPTTAPMLSVVSAGAAAGVGGMDRLRGGRAARELAATRDRQVRLNTVRADIAINLPPSIALPDGEEHPFTSSRLHLRDPEQEAEIHQKCIRPPPNRTVLESESPPPYRSSSAGLLGSSTSSSTSSSGTCGGGGDWSGGGNAPLVVRCHSMSSTSSKRPEAGSSGQKTDFLHRTVKIFTGGKKGTGGGGAPPPVQTLPVVIVPTRPRRTSSEQQTAATARSKPSV